MKETTCESCRAGNHRECKRPRSYLQAIPNEEITPNPIIENLECCDGKSVWSIEFKD